MAVKGNDQLKTLFKAVDPNVPMTNFSHLDSDEGEEQHVMHESWMNISN